MYFIFFALILLPLYRQWSSKKLFTGFLIGVSIIAVVANILLLPYILPSLKQGREDATLLKNFENDFEQIKLGMPKSQAHQMIVSNLEKLPKKLQNDPLTPMPSILPKIENRASLINGRLYGDPNQDPLVNATDTDPEVINLLHTYLTQNPKAKIKFDSCEYSPSNGIVFSFYLCYKNDRLAYKAHGNAFEHRNYTGPNPPPRIEVIQASAKLDPNILRQLIAQPEF